MRLSGGETTARRAAGDRFYRWSGALTGASVGRAVYAAIGVTLDGEKDVLGLWAGTGGEGAKFWMSVLTDLRNRGVKDVFFVVCDG